MCSNCIQVKLSKVSSLFFMISLSLTVILKRKLLQFSVHMHYLKLSSENLETELLNRNWRLLLPFFSSISDLSWIIHLFSTFINTIYLCSSQPLGSPFDDQDFSMLNIDKHMMGRQLSSHMNYSLSNSCSERYTLLLILAAKMRKSVQTHSLNFWVGVWDVGEFSVIPIRSKII